MRYFRFRHILGTFKVDEKGQVLGREADSGLPDLPDNLLPGALAGIRDKINLKRIFSANLRICRQDIKGSVQDDLLIIQAIRIIDDLNHVINVLSRRIREWYDYYNPEFSRICDDNETFIRKIIAKTREDLLREADTESSSSMGADLQEEDTAQIIRSAKACLGLIDLKQAQKSYIEEKMQKICPNTLALTGTLIGAKLIEHAGSLRHLSELPASTVQLLGAEKALFKHLTTGAKCPKYGVIFNHPFVQGIKQKMRGKAARLLADKISIAAKVDYFKGDFIGDKLKEQLEEKGKRL